MLVLLGRELSDADNKIAFTAGFAVPLRQATHHCRRDHGIDAHHRNDFFRNGEDPRQVTLVSVGQRDNAIGSPVEPSQNAIRYPILAVWVGILRDRRVVDLAQHELGPAMPRQCAHRDKRAEIEARFRADDDIWSDTADGAPQARNRITQLSSRYFDHANGAFH